MNMKKVLYVLILLVVVSAEDTTTVFMDTTLRDSTVENFVEPTNKAELKQKKKRYKVVSAVMMMLFIGLAMGTSQSNNPK